LEGSLAMLNLASNLESPCLSLYFDEIVGPLTYDIVSFFQTLSSEVASHSSLKFHENCFTPSKCSRLFTYRLPRQQPSCRSLNLQSTSLPRRQYHSSPINRSSIIPQMIHKQGPNHLSPNQTLQPNNPSLRPSQPTPPPL
jgi:hypothetical protein